MIDNNFINDNVNEHYRHLNKYLKEKFGERTLKICIDGGFSCPNRDGTCGVGGCIFCSERGSGDLINICNSNDSITNSMKDSNIIYRANSVSMQVHNYFSSYRSKRANKFIAYFQNFTNTYDSIPNLKTLYDSALIDDRIVALDVATRPDCITEDIVKLLHTYAARYAVTVELGLQTSNNDIAFSINRGYDSSVFVDAVNLLRKYNIDVVAHIMVGLPGECEKVSILDNPNDVCLSKLRNKDVLNNYIVYPNWAYKNLISTVNFINELDIQGLKIHSTYVVNGTKLCGLFEKGKYTPISLEDYLDSLCFIITHIRSDIVIHRLSADAPRNLLVAPDWNSHKKWVINGIDKLLNDKSLYQGMYYKD